MSLPARARIMILPPLIPLPTMNQPPLPTTNLPILPRITSQPPLLPTTNPPTLPLATNRLSPPLTTKARSLLPSMYDRQNPMTVHRNLNPRQARPLSRRRARPLSRCQARPLSRRQARPLNRHQARRRPHLLRHPLRLLWAFQGESSRGGRFRSYRTSIPMSSTCSS